MHIEMEPMQGPEHDDEGRMAKADLYKIAKYSLKLFKQLESDQQLEGWVQAKITKAADYIASVYHYMEYEMKFSEYGQAIEDSDVYTESQKRALKNKLFEAKEKIKDLKKVQAEKLKKKEKKDIEEASGFRATDKKKGKVDKSEKKQYFVKLEKEGKTKGMTMVADEGETEGDIRDRAKRDNQGWSVASVRVKDTGSGEEVSEGKRMKDKKSQEGNKFTGNLMKARAAGKKSADLDGDGDMEKVKEDLQSGTSGAQAVAHYSQAVKKLLQVKDSNPKLAAEWDAYTAQRDKWEKISPRGLEKAATEDGEMAMKLLKKHGLPVQESPSAARAARSAVAQDLAGATAPGATKETAISGAPQKTGIPATAKTTVPGMRATQQDLKKANSSAALGEKTKNKKSSENFGAGLKHIAKGAAGAVAGHVVGKAINPALAPAGAVIGSKLATS